MKKIIIVCTLGLFTAAGANAQSEEYLARNDIQKDKAQEYDLRLDKRKERQELRRLEGNDVGYQTKTAFYQDFGDVPITSMKRQDNFDEITFKKKDGHFYTAFYDVDSKLVGTTTQKKFTNLPRKAQRYIRKKYAGYKVRDVLFYDDNELNTTNMILYNMQFDDPDSYFVEIGKGNKEIVLHVDQAGNVLYFTGLPY